MRRSIATVIPLVAALAGAACEDGPSQTFAPAPTGAGTIWNGTPGGGGIPSEAGTFVSKATQTFGADANAGGQNANQTLTAVQEKAIWTKLFSAPMQPPGLAGGLDIAGGATGNGSSGYDPTVPFVYDATAETWTGCTLEQAELILGSATADSVYSGVTSTAGWGENLELTAYYNESSRAITDLLLEYGYVGTTVATSTDGSTTYTISMNNIPISVTTAAGTTQLILDWSDEVMLNKQVNAYYDAMRNTFLQSFPADTDCVAAGHCIVGNNLNQGGYIWLTPLNYTFFVDTTVGTQQANSIPVLVDVGLLKVLPFSGAATLLKLDSAGEGPTATATGLGPAKTTTCKYVLGMTFADFDTNCLEVYPAGSATNAVAKAKLFGAIEHGDEYWLFDVSGVDPQFAAGSLGQSEVIGDTKETDAGTTVCVSDAGPCLPSTTSTPADTAFALRIDQEVLGVISNDFTNNDPTKAKDLHGIGLVTLEWANLIQKYMQANYGVTAELGDPECIANPLRPTPSDAGSGSGSSGDAGTVGEGGADAAPAHDAGAPPATKICSGIEGIITSAPPASATGTMKNNALGTNATKVDPTIGVGLKPGTWYSVFCNGLGNPATGSGYGSCFGGQRGYKGNAAYFFDTMQSALYSAYGSAEPPVALQDRTFVFEQFVLAYVKYLQSAADPTATIATIDANVIDPNEIFFDSNGGGFVTAEYVSRGNVNSSKVAPTEVDVTVELETSVLNDFEFDRFNFRGETALYAALKDKSTDQPGAEPLFITNIVGSSVLEAVYGTYKCATNTDPLSGACKDIVPPQDPLTKASIYAPYADAFGQSFLNIAALGSNPISSGMTVNPTGFEFIQNALVTVPILTAPFNQSSAPAATPSISVLLSYAALGTPGAGFSITIDGSRDKFYSTNAIAFSGESVDGTVDYEYAPATGADGGIVQELVIDAYESTSYLGLVFACAEPSPTGVGTDILAVRMAQNGNDLLNWIAAHPDPNNSCGVQIKYSPYGNYPDYISFNNNGVRFGLNPGYGGSVITDCTIFNPNILAGLGQ